MGKIANYLTGRGSLTIIFILYCFTSCVRQNSKVAGDSFVGWWHHGDDCSTTIKIEKNKSGTVSNYGGIDMCHAGEKYHGTTYIDKESILRIGNCTFRIDTFPTAIDTTRIKRHIFPNQFATKYMYLKLIKGKHLSSDGGYFYCYVP
jgi:hypothetical protein